MQELLQDRLERPIGQIPAGNRDRAASEPRPDELRQAMQRLGISEISESTVLAHKTAVREAALHACPPRMAAMFRIPWLERALAFSAMAVLGIIKISCLIVLFAGVLAALGMLAAPVAGVSLPYGWLHLLALGSVGIALLCAWILCFWLVQNKVLAYAWTASAPIDNPDIPREGVAAMRRLQNELGRGVHFRVHRLGSDPFLEARFRGRSAYFFGWDGPDLLVERDRALHRVRPR